MITNTNATKYDALLNAYQDEADGFGIIYETDQFAEMLSNFENFTSFLKDKSRQTKSAKLIKTLSKGTGIIDLATNSNPVLKEILYYAHIAVCCELFQGWKIPIRSITRTNMRQYVQQAFSENYKNSDSNLSDPVNRYHRADASRTIQILRLLGLITISSENIRQISFAAGDAERDIHGIHMIPVIRRQRDKLTNNGNNVLLEFSCVVPRSKHLILIDNDPIQTRLYTKFNETHKKWIMALNNDAEDAMEKIPALLRERNWKPCNFVAGIRIDHRMVPDVARFMSKLATNLDTSADFVFSIGAGHNLEDFQGRVIVIGKLFDYLKQRGMSPVRINLHGAGDIEQQRQSPSFGYSPYATYEIIYCKLKKKKLM